MDKGPIKKSLSVNNISEILNGSVVRQRIYTPKEIFKMIDNYRHMYCPVCNTKNKGIVYYMALDMIFCSEYCRGIVCNIVSFKDLDDRKYLRKKIE